VHCIATSCIGIFERSGMEHHVYYLGVFGLQLTRSNSYDGESAGLIIVANSVYPYPDRPA
jgi:hypothetical protein